MREATPQNRKAEEEELNLSHYSSEPLPSDFRPVNQQQDDDLHPFSKPKGLWISVDGEDDWLSWCIGEQFMLENLMYRQEVILRADANILYIRDSEELVRFNDEYFHKYKDYSSVSIVDWARVAAKYDGIIIAPYIWSKRLDFDCTWYYGWDCASGCIWNSDAIEAVIPDEGWVGPEDMEDDDYMTAIREE